MKKLTMLLLCVAMMLCLVACGKDETNAYAEVISSNGNASILSSYNYTHPWVAGLGQYKSGLTKAIKCSYSFTLSERETLTVHFVCPQCSHDETVELSSPSSRILFCDCEEKPNNNVDGVKEYLSIVVMTSGQKSSE